MATIAQNLPGSPRPLVWFWDFLKQELTPYSGRFETVARMAIAATLAMIIYMVFRIPYGYQGAIFALLISRESPRATLQSAGTTLLVTGIGVAYLLISVWFVISVPLLHFLWVIGSLFLAFYALSAITNYFAAVVFAVMISVGVPLWDRQVPAETNVEDTLWLCLAAAIGVLATTAVELAFARLRPGDQIVLPVSNRLSAVQDLLACYAEGRAVDPETEQKLIQLEMLGTSRLRRLLRRSGYSTEYSAQMGGVVALVGMLVDLAAALTQLSFEPSSADQTRLRNLVTTIARIRDDLVNRQIPGPVQFISDDESARGIPLLSEMENVVTLIPQAFADSRSIHDYQPSSDEIPQSKLLAPDALVNSEHLKFALKGCLAASACYIVYNAIAWPGLITSLPTCLLTALSTIGSSRQKQILRLGGTVVGGFLIGMGSQIFILPYVDSITGFTLLFIIVTLMASWFMTSSPRLSYFGVQLALTYYLINLQEFARQTSLSIARDRVVGVLLALFMMWLIFDQLWSAPAGVAMRKSFVSSLRLLAQLAREPLSTDIPAAIKRSFALRETINTQFDNGRALADGVLFEFGPSRQRDLVTRGRIRRWQPQLRTLFLMRVASLKYRSKLPGFELPDAVRTAQQEYDDRSAQMLEEMADTIEGKPQQAKVMSDDSLESVEQKVRACCAQDPQSSVAEHAESFVTLLRGIDRLTISLAEQIAKEFK